MKNLFIISDAIGCGKSTYLSGQVKSEPGIFTGVISLLQAGKRILYIIDSEESIKLEFSPATDGETPVLKVGKYMFLESAFSRANELIKYYAKPGKKILILDEIGPLELAEKGLYDSLNDLILRNEDNNFLSVLVIRENLLQEVLNFFNLTPIRIFSLADLNGFSLRSLIQEAQLRSHSNRNQ